MLSCLLSCLSFLVAFLWVQVICLIILTLILAPLGLQAFANEILFGLWCMAAPIAAIFVPRVGSATIGEVLAALAEVLYGSQFGLGALLSGLVQGLGSELGFIVTKNRYESWLSLTANSIGDYAC